MLPLDLETAGETEVSLKYLTFRLLFFICIVQMVNSIKAILLTSYRIAPA